jgi:serine/threonine-protein kinase
VPDVVGEEEASARATLQNEGWRVLIRDTPTTNPDEDGLVVTQTPAPGEQAEPGAQVIIYIGRFQEIEEPPPPPEEPAP